MRHGFESVASEIRVGVSHAESRTCLEIAPFHELLLQYAACFTVNLRDRARSHTRLGKIAVCLLCLAANCTGPYVRLPFRSIAQHNPIKQSQGEWAATVDCDADVQTRQRLLYCIAAGAYESPIRRALAVCDLVLGSHGQAAIDISAVRARNARRAEQLEGSVKRGCKDWRLVLTGTSIHTPAFRVICEARKVQVCAFGRLLYSPLESCETRASLS